MPLTESIRELNPKNYNKLEPEPMARKKKPIKLKKVTKGKKITKKPPTVKTTKTKSKTKKISKVTPKKSQKKGKPSKLQFKKQIKEILFQMRKELIEDVSQSIKTESDHLRFDVGDFYDHATSDRARELSLMLTDRERQKLIQIEEALKKIDEGSYGICESCGDEIDEERLIAMPFAKLCLSCKIDLERQGNL